MKTPRLLNNMIAGSVVLWVTLPTTLAAASSCTAVPSVSKCVKAVTCALSKPKSASSLCSSVLKCTETPTITLAGTITTTSTKLTYQTYTLKELGERFEITNTYSWTYSSSLASATTTEVRTSFVEKFVVTTVAARKREETLHPKDLAGRATTSLCASSVLSKACSCLITCPTTVTKDKRKTIKEKTTEISFVAKTSYIDYTETSYVEIPFTTTSYYISTITEVVVPTETRTIQCTPSVANPSFYLKATNVPGADNTYLHLYPDNFYGKAIDSHRAPRFTTDKSIAAAFHLDSTSRLVTEGKDGDLYGWADTYNKFELFTFASSADIIAGNEYRAFAHCKLNPPSGKYEGNYQELTCETTSVWNMHIFQYCPEYLEFYGIPLVLAAEPSPESPDCFSIVFLAVPVCQT